MRVVPNLIQLAVARAGGERRARTSGHRTVIQQKTRGRPDGTEAILDAAGELLVTRGLGALTLEGAARRANVDASLICRWRPSEQASALDALRHERLALVGGERRGAEGVWFYACRRLRDCERAVGPSLPRRVSRLRARARTR